MESFAQIVNYICAFTDIVKVKPCFLYVFATSNAAWDDELEISICVGLVVNGADHERDVGSIVAYVDKQMVWSELEGFLDVISNTGSQ